MKSLFLISAIFFAAVAADANPDDWHIDIVHAEHSKDCKVVVENTKRHTIEDFIVTDCKLTEPSVEKEIRAWLRVRVRNSFNN